MKILVTALLILPILSFAQSYNLKHEDIIKSLSQFRTAMLTDDISSLTNLKLLNDRIEDEDFEHESFKEIVFNIYMSRLFLNAPNEKILKFVENANQTNGTHYNFTEKDIDTIINNFKVLQFIFLGVLKKDYPYPLEKNFKLLEEYSFYDFQQSEKIGEVGAGDGTFSLTTGILYKGLELYVNDLGVFNIVYLRKIFNDYNTFVDSEKMNVVNGNKRSTNFEANTLDKIIIRNSFHHFKKKKKMLNSIKASLKDSGELYLYEPFNGLTDHDEQCRKIMLQDKCIRIIEDNGFKLEEAEQLDTRMLLRFPIKENQ